MIYRRIEYFLCFCTIYSLSTAHAHQWHNLLFQLFPKRFSLWADMLRWLAMGRLRGGWHPDCLVFRLENFQTCSETRCCHLREAFHIHSIIPVSSSIFYFQITSYYWSLYIVYPQPILLAGWMDDWMNGWLFWILIGVGFVLWVCRAQCEGRG